MPRGARLGGLIFLTLMLAAHAAAAAVNTTRADLIGTWRNIRAGDSVFFKLEGDGSGIYEASNITWRYAKPYIYVFDPASNQTTTFSILSEAHARMVLSHTDSEENVIYNVVQLDTNDMPANFATSDLIGSFEYTMSDNTKVTYTFEADGYGIEKTGSGTSTGKTFTWTYDNPVLTISGYDIQLGFVDQLGPSDTESKILYVQLYADGYLTLYRDNTLFVLKEK